MKKIIYLLLFLLMFTNFVMAEELQGGVTYTVDSARDYIQAGMPDGIEIPDNRYSFQEENIEKVVYSRNNSGEIVGVTVQYINESTKAYIYKKGNLAYVEKYDKPISIYPHRGYRYNLDSELVSSSLTVTKDELFRFDPAGGLIAHSVKGIIYDENGKVIGTAK